MLTDFVQDKRVLGFFLVEELMILHPHQHILVLIGCLYVLAVESTADTDL